MLLASVGKPRYCIIYDLFAKTLWIIDANPASGLTIVLFISIVYINKLSFKDSVYLRGSLIKSKSIYDPYRKLSRYNNLLLQWILCTYITCTNIVYILLQTKLGEKYGVRGIPTLIILDKDGNIKDAEARGTAQNCQGTELPAKWC